MGDDNTSGDPGSNDPGKPQTDPSQSNDAEPDVAKLQAKVEVLEKQVQDKDKFIGTQSNDIGTLRAQAEATKGQAENQKPTQDKEKTPEEKKADENKPFDFKDLPVEMQDRVKLFLKKQTEGLSDEQKQEYAEKLTPTRFNELAKQVLKEIDVDTEHIRNVNDILGITDPLSAPNAGDEDMKDILGLFKMTKKELNKTPPGGGSVQGGKPPKLESKPKTQQRNDGGLPASLRTDNMNK